MTDTRAQRIAEGLARLKREVEQVPAYKQIDTTRLCYLCRRNLPMPDRLLCSDCVRELPVEVEMKGGGP